MSKHLIIVSISVFFLIITSGCPPTQPEPEIIEPVKREPAPLPPSPPAPTEVKVTVSKPEPKKVEDTKEKSVPHEKFYEKCSYILENFVDSRGMVDYSSLKREKSVLNQWFEELRNLKLEEYNKWSKEDKLALWINAYNMQMLNIILQNYPIESTRMNRLRWPPTSIRHIPPTKEIGASKWNNYKFITIEEEFTLEMIQQRFFLKEFSEPRALLAVTQASMFSPKLRNKPYTGEKLYEQLDEQVKVFFESPVGMIINRERKIVYLSAIFQASWHGKSFIKKYGTSKRFKDHPTAVRAVLNLVTKYANENDTSYLEIGNYSVKYINYDWRLNDRSPKK